MKEIKNLVRRTRHFTHKDLKRVSQLYEQNYKAFDKGLLPKHIYIRRESRLNTLCIRIQKKLGVHVPDPCIYRYSCYCRDCERESCRLHPKKFGDVRLTNLP